MCGEPNDLRKYVGATQGKPPERSLSELLAKDTGAVVDQRTLRLFLLANWRKVCLYAHQIHDEAD